MESEKARPERLGKRREFLQAIVNSGLNEQNCQTLSIDDWGLSITAEQKEQTEPIKLSGELDHDLSRLRDEMIVDYYGSFDERLVGDNEAVDKKVIWLERENGQLVAMIFPTENITIHGSYYFEEC